MFVWFCIGTLWLLRKTRASFSAKRDLLAPNFPVLGAGCIYLLWALKLTAFVLQAYNAFGRRWPVHFSASFSSPFNSPKHHMAERTKLFGPSSRRSVCVCCDLQSDYFGFGFNPLSPSVKIQNLLTGIHTICYGTNWENFFKIIAISIWWSYPRFSLLLSWFMYWYC